MCQTLDTEHAALVSCTCTCTCTWFFHISCLVYNKFSRFEVLTARFMRIQTFLDVMLCRRMCGSRRFEGSWWIQLQVWYALNSTQPTPRKPQVPYNKLDPVSLLQWLQELLILVCLLLLAVSTAGTACPVQYSAQLSTCPVRLSEHHNHPSFTLFYLLLSITRQQVVHTVT